MPKTKSKNKITKRSVDARQTRAIRSLKKEVKALQAPIETKYLYSNITQLGINSLATEQTLNLIRAWDSSSPNANENRLSQREGYKVSMLRFMLKGKLEIPYPPP